MRETRELLLDSRETCFDGGRLGHHSGPGTGSGETRIISPPVQADLLRLVDRADEEPDLNRQQLDIREIDLDVARDDQPLIKDTVEDVDQAV